MAATRSTSDTTRPESRPGSSSTSCCSTSAGRAHRSVGPHWSSQRIGLPGGPPTARTVPRNRSMPTTQRATPNSCPAISRSTGSTCIADVQHPPLDLHAEGFGATDTAAGAAIDAAFAEARHGGLRRIRRLRAGIEHGDHRRERIDGRLDQDGAVAVDCRQPDRPPSRHRNRPASSSRSSAVTKTTTRPADRSSTTGEPGSRCCGLRMPPIPPLRNGGGVADGDDLGEGEVHLADADPDLVGLPRGHKAAGAVGSRVRPARSPTPACSHRSIVNRWSDAPVSRMRRVGTPLTMASTSGACVVPSAVANVIGSARRTLT